jgi:hypothetical protein
MGKQTNNTFELRGQTHILDGEQIVIDENNLKLLIKALAFAADIHRNQKRKNVDASPYIDHPISLASILCNEAHVMDVNVICGALLHDTVEDTDTTAEELLIGVWKDGVNTSTGRSRRSTSYGACHSMPLSHHDPLAGFQQKTPWGRQIWRLTVFSMRSIIDRRLSVSPVSDSKTVSIMHKKAASFAGTSRDA